MAITSSVQEWYVKKFVGMNSKLEDNELTVEQSVLTQNGRFENEPGSLVKRDPVTYFNDTEMDQLLPVHSNYRFKKSDGEPSLVAASGTKMYIGDSNGVMTAIRSGLTPGKKFQFSVYKDLLICGNGYDNMFVLDGFDNVSWELGACKAVGTGTSGNPNGTYYYAVVIEYQAGVDYICGAVSNTVTVSSKQISLTNIPIGPAGTVSRKIYRTATGGSTLKLLTTISDNTTVTYTDNTADAGLGATMGAVNDDMPKGALNQIHRERLFISGDPVNPNWIYYSDPYLPWFIQATTQLAYLEIFPNEGDEIQGMPIINDTLICFKRNTIRKIFITQPTSGASPESWYASDIVSYQGTPSRYSIVETIYGIMYLGWDHWYVFDGNNTRDIMDEFDTDDIFDSDYRNVVCFFNQGIFYAAYTDAATGSQTKDRLMTYNFRRQALNIDTVPVESICSYSGGDDTDELYYGSSKEGFVFFAERAEKVAKWKKKSDFDSSTRDDIAVEGEEDNPEIKISWDLTINELDQATHPEAFSAANSQINSLNGTIDMMDTTGTLTFPDLNLNVGSFGRIFWNETKFHPSDTIAFYFKTASTQSGLTAASWSSAHSLPNGTNISATPNKWVRLKAEFVANSTAGSPKIILADNFMIKFTYTKGGTDAETSVEFIHDIGFRNFDLMQVDKIFKKIGTNHESSGGLLRIDWETENASGSFTIDTASNPRRWESFFPSNAFGRKLRLKIYKNDLNDFKIKELHGLFTPEPVQI